MSTAGRSLLSAIVAKSDLKGYITLGLEEAMFKDSEAILFKFIHNHVKEYGVIPGIDTVEDKVGDVLVPASEPIEYYAVELEKRYLQTRMKSMMVEAGALLNTGDPEKAFSLAMAQMMDLSMKKNRHHLFDFKDAAPVIHAQYMKQKQMPDEMGIPFGLPTLDAMTGGMQPGDFVSVVGRPAMGKTFQLLSMAHYGWKNAGKVPLFDSLEMGALIIQQRLAAMNTNQNLTHLIKGMMTTKAYKDMITQLNLNAAMQSFWVADSNLSGNVTDCVMMCRQLKPSALYVDAAYLLEHEDKRLDKFTRIGANAELLKKRVAQDLGIPVVCSYQLNRGAVKGKKKEKGKGDDEPVGIEDIYGNDAIGQISSVVLGLLQSENIETKVEREISVLKGRSGESGKVRINWDFKNMDFSEIAPEAEQAKPMEYL